MIDLETLCKLAHISQPTFYRMVKNDPAFRDFVEPRKHKPRRGPVTYDDDILEWFGVSRTATQKPVDEPQEQPPVIAPQEPERPAEPSSEPVTVISDDVYMPRGSSVETVFVATAPQMPSEAFETLTHVITPDSNETRLQAEIESLRARLAKKESDYDELMRQNGQILMLFGAEKAEKQQLLTDGRREEVVDDRRRGLGERLRILFKGR